MKKINFKHFSKTSLTIRIILSLILIAFLVVVLIYERPISKYIYKWDDREIVASSKVSFIDVGQGDATLIELCDGKTMLIDCGPKSSAQSLVSYIKERNISTIDYFLVTHADADHIGGGVQIFENFDVKEFYRPMTYSSSETPVEDYPVHSTLMYDQVINAAVEEQAEMFFTSDAISWGSEDGDYFIKVLYPDKAYNDNNESSAVIKAQLNGFSFLLTGDADKNVEEKLIDKYGSYLHCNVLKVAHHGSNTSTCEEFVNMVKPSYAIISVGDNSYGHPNEDVLATLQNANAMIYSTKDMGSIVVLIGDGILNIVGADGKHIDTALITVVVCVLILLLFGIPDFKKKTTQTKKTKKTL